MYQLYSCVKDAIRLLFSMNLTGLTFFIAVGFVLIVYYCLPLKFRWIAIFGSNMLFLYAVNGKKRLAVMAVMLFSVWTVSCLFEKIKEKTVKESSVEMVYKNIDGGGGVRKLLLILTVCFNIAILILLKDFIFFTNLFNISNENSLISFFQKLAPIGISYWTLIIISYLFDCYKGAIKPQKNFAKFVAYAGYFPLLVSGPFIRYAKTGNLILEGNKFDCDKFCHGIQRIIWGVFKELVVAGRAAFIVNAIYNDFNTYQGFYVWVAVLFYVIQLYADFSGCIDIVLGVSELFGITLPENFNLPFVSTSIGEFWRRWHITLGFWLRDYVYFPLFGIFWKKFGAGFKKIFIEKYAKKIVSWMVLFISWFLIGFWHGGTWKYVMYGLYMWVIIVLGELFEPLSKKIIGKLKIDTQNFSWKLFQQIRTFILFMIGLALFRFNGGFWGSRKMYKAAFTKFNPWIFFDGGLEAVLKNVPGLYFLYFGIMIICVSGLIKIHFGDTRAFLAKQSFVFRMIINIVLMSMIVLSMGISNQEFIYGQF